jgi:hypothetical protein
MLSLLCTCSSLSLSALSFLIFRFFYWFFLLGRVCSSSLQFHIFSYILSNVLEILLPLISSPQRLVAIHTCPKEIRQDSNGKSCATEKVVEHQRLSQIYIKAQLLIQSEGLALLSLTQDLTKIPHCGISSLESSSSRGCTNINSLFI